MSDKERRLINNCAEKGALKILKHLSDRTPWIELYPLFLIVKGSICEAMGERDV